MATIKKVDKAGAKQSYMIITAVIVAFLFAFGVFSMSKIGHESVDGLGKAGLRLSNDKHTAGSKENEGGKEGRLITFELASLKAGARGTITIRTRPSWAPIGVGRFHELVDAGFFNECRFFRVVNNFIVQFGISGDPEVQKEWRSKILQDDPVVESNQRGTVTFATSGPNTRTTQMFINTNTNGNKFLDRQGFSPIAEVVEGMEFVDQINDEYQELPNQGKIQKKGNAYLEKEFPNLSYIASAKTS